MKKSFLICFFIAFLWSASAFAWFKNVNAVALGNNQAYISWTIGAGSFACSGYEVQWSTDSFTVSYQSIYTVPTICGASGNDEDYYFTHTHPDEHKKNYYRIYDPQGGYSPIRVVDFGALNGNYVIFPCPLTDNSLLTFENPSNERYVLDIVNAKGYRLYRDENVYTNQISLPKSWFEDGIYFFRLFSLSGNIIRGRFVVVN